MRRTRTVRQSSLRRAVALQHEVFAVAESLNVFREVVVFRLRRKDQRFISLVSTVQRGEESINELKGQLKEMVERRFDGKVREFRDRVCPTVSSDENVTMEDRCINKQIVDVFHTSEWRTR